MRATVKPRKQLEYELKRDGFNFGIDFIFNDKMFDLCLEEIEIVELDLNNSVYDFYSEGGDIGWSWNWKKEWFIPNSFKGE